MTAIDLVATSLNRRDEKPNQVLAVEIIRTKNKEWVRELVENLNHKNKNIQSDCLKVLYEIGERGSAELIAPYIKEFGEILKSKNNRLIWGTMIALDTIASVDPKGIFNLLSVIISAIDKGSVITIDHGVGILAKLSAVPSYSKSTFPLLIEQLKKCPIKQLPMYAEKSVTAINTDIMEQFIDLLETRISETERDSQRKRIIRVIEKVKSS